MQRTDIGYPPLITAGTLIFFYCVWAALHDLAHGDEGTLEWTVLAVSVLAFPFLLRAALRALTHYAKIAWLAVTATFFALYTAAALNALSHPKYPRDPQLAVLVLLAGLPLLALLGYHLIRELTHRRTRAGA